MTFPSPGLVYADKDLIWVGKNVDSADGPRAMGGGSAFYIGFLPKIPISNLNVVLIFQCFLLQVKLLYLTVPFVEIFEI